MTQDSYPEPTRLLLRGPAPGPGIAPPPFAAEPTPPAQPNFKRIILRYLPVALILAVLGVGAGFVSVVLTRPVYKARVLIEVQANSDSVFKDRQSGSEEPTQVNIATQIVLLRNEQFLGRVMERMRAESIPSFPAQKDLFGRVRGLLKTGPRDQMTLMQQALLIAIGSFDARPVNGTRVIELSADSTSPDVAAGFINTLANQYIEESLQSRSQVALRTNQWLSGQLEETRTRLKESEAKLQDFVRDSGNLFVSQQTTLADSRLHQLLGDLAAIQSDRIAKQVRYDQVLKAAPGTLPDVVDDEVLREYRTRIGDLRREEEVVSMKLTPSHPRVQAIETQIKDLQATLDKETRSVVQRIKEEYVAALEKEKRLRSAYAGEAGQVSAQAGKAAEYAAIKKENDILEQTYHAMQSQANSYSVSSSVPLSTIRLVDSSVAPIAPYKPRPAINLAFGGVAGLLLAIGIAFVREKTDQSVGAPGFAGSLVSVRELGVIPSASLGVPRKRKLLGARMRKADALLPGGRNGSVPASPDIACWEQHPSLMAEAFRMTVASLVKSTGNGKPPGVVLVTSPGAGEGKTTVASNLGIALAEIGRSVVIVDADCRRPRAHEVFGAENDWGLTNLLEEPMPFSSYPSIRIAVPTQTPLVSMVPNGSARLNIAKALHSARFENLCGFLRTKYDCVIIDAPPIRQIADARVMAHHADGAILVVRSGLTDRSAVAEACQILAEDRTPLLGTILNDWNPGPKSSYYRAYSQYFSA